MKILKLVIGCFMGFLVVGCSLFGISNEEQPHYTVLMKQDNKEIRKYSSYIVAKTTVNGSFKEAQKKGFRILAGYIFGKNKSKQKIQMTSPVVQIPDNEKISMTAPVVITQDQPKAWTMTFSMPSKFTLETLPTPTDEKVKLEKIEEKIMGVLTFSGFWSESKNENMANELKEWIKKLNEYQISSTAMFAGYNPPWTLPFLRRNEMIFELKKMESK